MFSLIFPTSPILALTGHVASHVSLLSSVWFAVSRRSLFFFSLGLPSALVSYQLSQRMLPILRTSSTSHITCVLLQSFPTTHALLRPSFSEKSLMVLTMPVGSKAKPFYTYLSLFLLCFVFNIFFQNIR